MLHTRFYYEDAKKHKKFNKLLLVICQILTSETLWSCAENVLQKLSYLVIDTTRLSDNPLNVFQELIGVSIESNHDHQ